MESNVMTVEQVLAAFDAAWARQDLEAIVALFAADATLESPLVPRLLERGDGALHGHDEIRHLVRALLERGTPWGSHEPPIIQGDRVAIEFRGPPEQGAGFYSVDVMHVTGGRIRSLRAYTGWRAIAAANAGPRPA